MNAGFEWFESTYRKQLQLFEEKGVYRTLSPLKPGLLDLTHNDYLGLRSNRKFQKSVLAKINGLPIGAGASRLLGGEFEIFRQLEEQFAHFKQAESALFFSSGYAANEALGQCFAQEGFHVFSDKLNHASIIDGLRLAKLSKDQLSIITHKDLSGLEHELKQSRAKCNIIYTESLYSMDGDQADLSALSTLCDRYNGVLVVDEAHAIGCYGKHGRGLIDTFGLSHKNIISVNTCGKALACQGAFICAPQWFRDYLINTARSFIFTTAPSPWIAAALMVSLEWVKSAEDSRCYLNSIADHVREQLAANGHNLGNSESYIIPIICGSNKDAIALANKLAKSNIRVRPIRPPTVPKNQARIRIALNSELTTKNLEDLIEAIGYAS